MKKVILSLAILVATSISAFAATDNNADAKSPACKSQTTCSRNGVCGDKKDKPCKRDKAFEGINLTAEQKSKLEELRKNREEARKNKVEGKACCKDSKECKDKKDCPKNNLTAEQKKQMKAELKAKKLEAKKKYLNDVKSILTPEQYNQFLENSYLSKSDVKGHGKKMHRKGDKMNRHRDGKRINKNVDRQNKNADRA